MNDANTIFCGYWLNQLRSKINEIQSLKDTEVMADKTEKRKNLKVSATSSVFLEAKVSKGMHQVCIEK